MHFENTEENKLVYMDIFKKWQGNVEVHIAKKMNEMLPDFNMEDYVELIN